MGATRKDTRQKLGWVEFGRGCAALIVFLTHGFFVDFPKELSFVFLWGRWGVDFFFVLSGFIIAHVHWQDIGRPDRMSHFCWRRFIRIFPTYWLALALLLIVRNGLGSAEYRIALSTGDVLGNILMWPSIPDLMLSMAWTLRHELLFYALFSLLILNVRVGTIAFACWLALLLWTLVTQTPCETLTVAAERCMAANAALPPDNPIWRIITLNVNLYFFIGIGLARCLKSGTIGRVVIATLVGAVGAFGVDQLTGSPYALAAFQAFAICFFVSLAIFLSNRVSAPAFAYWFGTISYPLYLVHMTMMLVAHGLIKRLPLAVPWQVTTAFALVLSLLASHLIAFHFESRIRKISSKLLKWRT
ncbi:acyltransferase [Frankia sp. RB7]|nr:acyltransferase [Frankia sp. RB7]